MIKRLLLVNPALYVIIGIVTSALAQILLKRGSAHQLFAFKWLVYLFLSVFSYFLAFLSYYIALRYFEISKISPIMMSSIVSIIAIYGFFTGESFSNTRIAGIILAIVSIFLISKS